MKHLSIHRFWLTLLGLGITAFTIRMATLVWPYLSFEYAKNFLGTKPNAVLDKWHFQWAFYIHITTSTLVIALGIFQFIPAILRRRPQMHRRLGMSYIILILIFAAPSGLVLAIYANGGLSTQIGFGMQCLLWWSLTMLSLREILKKRYLQHVEMSIRSFAITLAAMSLRTESYLMFQCFHTKPMETYLTVTWLSWVGNWMLAELCIYLGLGTYFLARYKSTQL